MAKITFKVTAIQQPANSPRRVVQLTSIKQVKDKTTPTVIIFNLDVANDAKEFPLEMDSTYEITIAKTRG